MTILPRYLTARVGSLWSRLAKRPNLRAFLKLNLGSLLSKGAGFVRQPLLLVYLGRTQADYLLASDRVGQVLTLLFVTGTLYNALVPQLVQARNTSRHTLEQTVSWLFLLLTLGLGVATVGLLWRLDWILTHWIKPEFLNSLSSLDRRRFVFAIHLLLVSPFLFTYQSLGRAYLSTQHRYNSTAAAGVVSGVVVIGSILLSQGNYLRVAVGMVLGFVLSTGIILWECFAVGFRLRFGSLRNTRGYLRNFLQNALPRTLIVEPLAAAALILVRFVDFDGQITAFEIWTSIVTAFGFLTVSYLTVAFPELSTYRELTRVEKQSLIKKSFQNLWRVGRSQILLSIIGGFIVFYLYDLFFGIALKGYLSLLLALGIPSIVFGVFRGYFQQLLFALEDNFVLTISLVTNGGLLLTTYVLTRLGFDAGVALVLGLNLVNLVSVGLSWAYLRRNYRMRFW